MSDGSKQKNNKNRWTNSVKRRKSIANVTPLHRRCAVWRFLRKTEIRDKPDCGENERFTRIKNSSCTCGGGVPYTSVRILLAPAVALSRTDDIRFEPSVPRMTKIRHFHLVSIFFLLSKQTRRAWPACKFLHAITDGYVRTRENEIARRLMWTNAAHVYVFFGESFIVIGRKKKFSSLNQWNCFRLCVRSRDLIYTQTFASFISRLVGDVCGLVGS